MKRGTFGIAMAGLGLATILSTAQAGPQYVPNPICVHAKSISIDVMSMRQNGDDRKAVEAMAESELAQAIIDAAYAEPVVSMDERLALVIEFSDTMFGYCDDALGGVYGIAI